MHCVLILNPVAGRSRHLKQAQVTKVARTLESEGHTAVIVATTGPGSATSQAREAISNRADVIFACGGDGTAHEVLQGLVSETGTPACTMGVIPLGSANALARHLRISLDPSTAALQQIRGKACTIPVGRIAGVGNTRYFVVMAGAGADGALVYSLLASHKSQLGRTAYYLHAARLFATRRFRSFEVEFTRTGAASPITTKAVSAMAVRVGNLGGLFDRLTMRSTSVHDSSLQLYIVSPPALLSLPLWFVSGWIGLVRLNPMLRRVEVSSLSCKPTGKLAPHMQADGEWIGRAPLEISMMPNALRILLPNR